MSESKLETETQPETPSKAETQSKTETTPSEPTPSKTETQSKACYLKLPVGLDKTSNLHFTMFYFSKLTAEQRNGAIQIYRSLVAKHIKADDSGAYPCEMHKGEMWGKNSVLILGEIHMFKRKLDRVLEMSKLGPLMGIPRVAHVDVQGKHETELLTRVDLMDYIV